MEYLGAGFTLLVLAIPMVTYGDLVSRRHQNWTTILIVSIGVPVLFGIDDRTGSLEQVVSGGDRQAFVVIGGRMGTTVVYDYSRRLA